MRRHVVSTIYNNFIYMYINLFEKRYLANRLARKTKNSCTAFFLFLFFIIIIIKDA